MNNEKENYVLLSVKRVYFKIDAKTSDAAYSLSRVLN